MLSVAINSYIRDTSQDEVDLSLLTAFYEVPTVPPSPNLVFSSQEACTPNIDSLKFIKLVFDWIPPVLKFFRVV